MESPRLVAVGEHEDAPVGQDAVGVHEDQADASCPLDDGLGKLSHATCLLEQLRAPEVVDLQDSEEPPGRIEDGERGDLPLFEEPERFTREGVGGDRHWILGHRVSDGAVQRPVRISTR